MREGRRGDTGVPAGSTWGDPTTPFYRRALRGLGACPRSQSKWAGI